MRGIRQLYHLLAPRAHSAIMMGALFCTLCVKLYHSVRYGMTGEYLSWIWADIAVILGLEVVLTLCCARWPKRWMIRTVTIIAAVICTWSVLNGGWVVRTGTQVLPGTLLPLFRDPLNALGIVGDNLLKHPLAAIALLGPSAIALTFFFFVLVRPQKPSNTDKIFTRRLLISLALVLVAIPAGGASARSRNRSSSQGVTSGLRYNSQLKALATMVFPDDSPLTRADFENAQRQLPYAGDITLPMNPEQAPMNLVLVVLEGVQYRYTSLEPDGQAHTPYLKQLAQEGITYSQMRTVLTHTSKALFSLHTGRYPSGSQDVVEAVPAPRPFMSLPTVLEQQGYRTAFFQSAKGDFESRPTLVDNLGFQKYFSRDDLNDPNAHVSYLAADEFAMLPHINQWLTQSDQPFFATLLCSVTHDPYQVPEWYGELPDETTERYQQVIEYTDGYFKAIDQTLKDQGLRENTILCIVGDHGEAFGEHGKMGHDQIGFEEVLRIPWVIRAPHLQQPQQITEPVSSVDVTPTLLGLMGYDTTPASFDGMDTLKGVPPDRRVYFSCWNPGGPAGYIEGHTKYVYTPCTALASVFNLSQDPWEQTPLEIGEIQASQIAKATIDWKKQSLLKPQQSLKGQTVVYNQWRCRWAGRDPRSKYTGDR